MGRRIAQAGTQYIGPIGQEIWEFSPVQYGIFVMFRVRRATPAAGVPHTRDSGASACKFRFAQGKGSLSRPKVNPSSLDNGVLATGPSSKGVNGLLQPVSETITYG